MSARDQPQNAFDSTDGQVFTVPNTRHLYEPGSPPTRRCKLLSVGTPRRAVGSVRRRMARVVFEDGAVGYCYFSTLTQEA